MDKMTKHYPVQSYECPKEKEERQTEGEEESMAALDILWHYGKLKKKLQCYKQLKKNIYFFREQLIYETQK